MKTSKILKYVGIVIGAIFTLTLVSQHPVIVLMIGLGALSYFVGQWLDKQGK